MKVLVSKAVEKIAPGIPFRKGSKWERAGRSAVIGRTRRQRQFLAPSYGRSQLEQIGYWRNLGTDIADVPPTYNSHQMDVIARGRSALPEFSHIGRIDDLPNSVPAEGMLEISKQRVRVGARNKPPTHEAPLALSNAPVGVILSRQPPKPLQTSRARQGLYNRLKEIDSHDAEQFDRSHFGKPPVPVEISRTFNNITPVRGLQLTRKKAVAGAAAIGLAAPFNIPGVDNSGASGPHPRNKRYGR